MPTITKDSQYERQLIVQTAIGCFLKRGVPEASMEDIVRESGLSPDVVYRHFPGKNDILRVLGAINKAAAAGPLKETLQETRLPPADEIMDRATTFFEKAVENRDPVSIVPQAWGIALYDDEVNVIMREVLAELGDLWNQLAARLADEGQLPDGADPQDVGRIFSCIICGFILLSLLGDVKAAHVRRALHALFR
jgi:AcrR family transcriptional regulator